MIDLSKGLATAGLSDFWVIVFVKRMNIGESYDRY